MFKIIGQIFFVIIFFSTSSVKALDKFDKAESLSNYFSGLLLLNDNQYENSLKYFKKLNGLENNHLSYSIKYLYSLVNSGNIKAAFNYSKNPNYNPLDVNLVGRMSQKPTDVGMRVDKDIAKKISETAAGVREFLRGDPEDVERQVDDLVQEQLHLKSKGYGLKVRDYKTKMEQFKKYVQLIRNNEKILGDFEKKKQKEEVEMLKTSRKGIYYLNDLKKGKKVTSKNLFLRRPWGGLSLFDVKKILKHRLLKDVKKNEKLKINDFKK